MQFTDDEQIYSVSTDTNLKLITQLETTISELQAALKTMTDFIKEKGYGDAPEVAGACIMVERAELNATIAGVLKDIVVTVSSLLTISTHGSTNQRINRHENSGFVETCECSKYTIREGSDWRKRQRQAGAAIRHRLRFLFFR